MQPHGAVVCDKPHSQSRTCSYFFFHVSHRARQPSVPSPPISAPSPPSLSYPPPSPPPTPSPSLPPTSGFFAHHSLPLPPCSRFPSPSHRAPLQPPLIYPSMIERARPALGLAARVNSAA